MTGPDKPAVSRRGLLLGAVAAGGVAAGAGGALGANAAFAGRPRQLNPAYPFYGGAEQAGIRTPPQLYTVYMTFDLTSPLRSDLQVLLARWSGAIAQLMAGQSIGQVEPSREDSAGTDTGEALGLGPASLTVTVGLGPRVFTGTYGLAAQKPALLRDLKPLPSDALDPAITGGDLSLQACADDPQVAYHAIRNLARLAKGTAETRWAALGFGRASAGPGQVTPRNLLGFKDGTRNIREDADFQRFVWVTGGPQWQRHGSYQVVRKIQMHVENWDTDRVGDQNSVFGRHKESGAPLTGTHEFDTPDFTAKDTGGTPVIDPTAHIALAAHENNGGLKILRRSYNYTDGINQVGQLDAGLLFVSYQNDPAHFETLQSKLGASDALNEYISHIGSAVFFTPPAPPEGSYLGEAMFR
ncbi:deferrochelatase/peroxidase EfeB [Actinoplanes sp. TBRC 11911]|uniref:iron uptake transporter deferrochelatase/peroxidase subunit n=1 Tax=Actinoplanes sp. TBRC 11911 TaxID=2729386 RepID=UPI00145CB5CC|nr:iron uptake transporter deferrochelatase/peroxidase subunit [Actinoplanes sp. TBRC 11911]NMO54562.1 deferrochelatase/peroxidase EfeB [Actinoplanes sp. TBRC 11911]